MKFGRFMSNFIRASDVEEDTPLTISSIEVEEVGQDKTEIPVLYSEELDRGIVLSSKAIKEQLVERLGDETDAWIGKTIVVFNDKSVMYKGKRVGGIRIREDD